MRGLSIEESLACLQMVLPRAAAIAQPAIELVPLSCADAPAMVELTKLAFPGLFRARTREMGRNYGVRVGNELVAMGVERLALDGFTEISALCVHPEYRGRGYAADIIRRIALDHRREGVVSWLHEGAANAPAIKLCEQFGFVMAHEVVAWRLLRI